MKKYLLSIAVISSIMSSLPALADPMATEMTPEQHKAAYEIALHKMLYGSEGNSAAPSAEAVKPDTEASAGSVSGSMDNQNDPSSQPTLSTQPAVTKP